MVTFNIKIKKTGKYIQYNCGLIGGKLRITKFKERATAFSNYAKSGALQLTMGRYFEIRGKLKRRKIAENDVDVCVIEILKDSYWDSMHQQLFAKSGMETPTFTKLNLNKIFSEN